MLNFEISQCHLISTAAAIDRISIRVNTRKFVNFNFATFYFYWSSSLAADNAIYKIEFAILSPRLQAAMRSEKVSLQLDWNAIYIGAIAEAISVEISSCELKVARWWRENFQLNFAAARRVLHAIFLNYHKSMAICNLQLIYRPLIASNNGKINRIIKKNLARWTFSLPESIFVHSSNFLFLYYFPLLAIIFRAALTDNGQMMNFDSRVNAEWADGGGKVSSRLIIELFSFPHRTLYFEAGWTVALEKYEILKCLKAFRDWLHTELQHERETSTAWSDYSFTVLFHPSWIHSNQTTQRHSLKPSITQQRALFPLITRVSYLVNISSLIAPLYTAKRESEVTMMMMVMMVLSKLNS